jgi:hypothetical protein
MFSGSGVFHSVGASREERVVFSYYMKNNVRESLGIDAPSWLSITPYGIVLQ